MGVSAVSFLQLFEIFDQDDGDDIVANYWLDPGAKLHNTNPWGHSSWALKYVDPGLPRRALYSTMAAKGWFRVQVRINKIIVDGNQRFYQPAHRRTLEALSAQHEDRPITWDRNYHT